MFSRDSLLNHVPHGVIMFDEFPSNDTSALNPASKVDDTDNESGFGSYDLPAR